MEINEYLLAFATNPRVQQIFWTVVLGAATIIVARIAARAMRHLLNMDSNPLPSSSIIVNIVRAVIWIVGASIIIDGVYGQSTNAIFTALGVGGIAVSLGFQDTLSNLIGGLQMTLMGIIKPGDNIEIGTEKGVVQDISWRHTTIKDPMGQTVIVPNSVISKTAPVHLLPANRGILATCYARLKDGVTMEELLRVYHARYDGEYFVRLLPQGRVADIKNVWYSNFCDVSLHMDPRTNTFVAISAIDNMVKGAAGQAVQNMNLAFGLDETEGLRLFPPAF